MKLAVVSPYPPGWRGVGDYARHVVQGLAVHDGPGEIVVLAERVPGAPTREQDGPIDVRRVWTRHRPDTPAVVLRELVRLQPDVVWYNVGLSVFGSGASAFLALSMPALTKALSFPTVVTMHEVVDAVDVQAIGASLGPVGRTAARLATRLLLTADTVCVTLDSYRTLLRDRYGRGDIVHLPHGILLPPTLSAQEAGSGKQEAAGGDEGSAAFGSPVAHSTAIADGTGNARSFPFPASCFLLPGGGAEGDRVLMLANQAPHKGLDLLLEAYARLLPRYPGLALDVVGLDHPRFPGYLAGMRVQWGHLPQVRWMGYLSEEQLSAAFEAATVVAVPSRATTGASSVLARAAAHGRAAVVADLPDLREMTRDAGLAVRFFPAGSDAGLAQSLDAVLGDPAVREQMEAQNRAAGHEHGLAQMCAAYHRLFLNLVARKAAPYPHTPSAGPFPQRGQGE